MSGVFDNRSCELGEGPLWHPEREQLFWFDILGKRLLSQRHGKPLQWQFTEMVSAAGWINADELLIASESALFRFNLATGVRNDLCLLEANNPATRSNDGRADPYGGFWIGTMGKAAEPQAGTIYRYYGGELKRLFHALTIPNAICFTPDGRYAHFADTVTRCVMRVALDDMGWPKAVPETFLDLRAEGLNPDGAVVDAAGNLWLAQWGAGRVAAYAPSGDFLRAVSFAAPHTSCPAFGGSDLMTLFCTSALQGMEASARAETPDAGKIFAAQGIARGQYEHQVTL
ncbi:SMP-30/gluconolactonase/LRE family protein [Rhodobacter ferrooxidans]|uniref:SMP-30/Gluconolaconase/LRE domain protein n=1 Tax=Rhodobacter ferrooxidans TaxID=371731 RepID=C8RWU6_9RHOB|nr:SMP-30/gluconolactonase/LRE family protein [Rhodobacter sp. SW2]EEW27039.1 SMP-30/Gluconolaconase/LRE domain protein [Rhodobacter sp. SW2]